jgi:hypothetical protein
VCVYPGAMAEPAAAILPDEAPDVTTNELHARVLWRLQYAVTSALRGRALVLADIFLRVAEREQVAPDLLVAPGLQPGERTVYSVPPEPVPAVTFEVLSPINRERHGRLLLESKRALLGRIGIPLHVEIDPDDGFITAWTSRDGALQRTGVTTSFTHPAIGDVRVDTPSPGVVHVILPNGREVLGPDQEAARAEALAARLRALGVDPDEA